MTVHNGHRVVEPRRGDYRMEFAAETPAQVERLRTLAETLLTRNAQLEYALESRIVIEQAKGMLSERLGISVDGAFDLLRSAARRNRRRVRDLASDVLASRETPEAIRTALGDRMKTP